MPMRPQAQGGVNEAEALALLGRELSPELELIRPLAEGRTGRVYLAREARVKRLVAVKVLDTELAGDRVARARFEREARAAAALDHPHAVTLHRFGYLTNGVPFLVMQYVKGGTLEDKLAAEGVLPMALARRILGEVADALAAAHQSGFVHRDLRAGNVLCDEEHGRVLVSDFGLAGVVPEAQEDARITSAGELVGMPEISSPEQLRGEEATAASDIYALGILGYQLLAGDGPFTARRGSSLIAAHLRESPRPLLSLRPDADPGLAELVERCLAKDPLKRPRAAFLAQAFRELPAPEHAVAASPRNGAGTGGDVLTDLLRRRMPQIVAVTFATGLTLLGFLSNLADRGLVSELAFRLSLCTVVYCVAAATVVAWFHGKPGRQRVVWAEVAALGLVGAAWLLTCTLIVLF